MLLALVVVAFVYHDYRLYKSNLVLVEQTILAMKIPIKSIFRLLRTFLILVIVGSYGGIASAQAKKVISEINGVAALRSLLSDKPLQKNLAMSDEQIAALTRSFDELGNLGAAWDKGQSTAYDSLVRVLRRDQMTGLRIENVKRQFQSRLKLFEQQFLLDLGLDEQLIVEIRAKLSPLFEKLAKQIDDLSIQCLKDSLSPNEQEILWRFIGEDLKIVPQEDSWERIAVLPAASIERQLMMASTSLLQGELAITLSQRKELRDLKKEVLIARAQKLEKPDLTEISKRLDNLLRKSQRFAIVQRIQQQEIQADILVVMHPQILKHFNLSEDGVAQTRSELSNAKVELLKARKILEFEVFEKALATLPDPFRKSLLELIDGVWNNESN